MAKSSDITRSRRSVGLARFLRPLIPQRYRLTILIPTYNRARFLERALDNLLPQTAQFPFVELVVSDNRSTDETACILERFAGEPRLRIIRPAFHLASAEENLEFAIHYCSGEFFWAIGDDDRVEPTGVRQVLDLLEAEPADFYLMNSAIHYESRDKVKLNFIPLRSGPRVCGIQELVARVGVTTIAASLSSVVLRTKMLRASRFSELVRLSPIYSHVAAYLDGFASARCILGAASPVTIREAGTALESFAEYAEQTGGGFWDPFGTQLSQLLGRLVDWGVVSAEFPSTILELGHAEREYLLNYVIAHCIKQVRGSLREQRPMTCAQLRALLRIAARADSKTRDIAERLIALVARFDEHSEIGDIEYELTQLDEINRGRLNVRREVIDPELCGSYAIFRCGWDWLGVRQDCLARYSAYFDVDVVDPSELEPLVLLGSSPHELKERIQRAELRSGSSDLSNSAVVARNSDTRALEDELHRLICSDPRSSVFFDPVWYWARNPEAAARTAGRSGMDAVEDYIRHGARTGASPNPWFDEDWYLASIPAARNAVLSGRVLSGFHFYLLTGRHNGHDPSPRFSESSYLEINKDVANAMASGAGPSCGLEHWMRDGLEEGRSLGARNLRDAGT